MLRGTVSDILSKLENPKGEMILLLDVTQVYVEETEELNHQTVEEQYAFYEKQGMEKKEIIKIIAKNQGVSKNEIYQKFLKK